MSETSPKQDTTAPQDDPVRPLVDNLIVRVGERVRAAREAKGIPRRILSEMSGVSPRYLAHLEAGEGNISIGLLQRVAVALDHPIEGFLADDDPSGGRALGVADLFGAASAEVQKEVLRLLQPIEASTRRARRLCLIGLRGAGKSTLGAQVGRTLGLPFIELNNEIEDQAGIPVTEVIALYGQEGYRRLEGEAIARIIATHDDVILAVAGGIVSTPETYEHLLANFHAIWLRTSPEEHMARVRDQGDERPMAGNPRAMDQLRSILTSREAQYGKALAKLDTSSLSVEVSLGQLIALIRTHGFLN